MPPYPYPYCKTAPSSAECILVSPGLLLLPRRISPIPCHRDGPGHAAAPGVGTGLRLCVCLYASASPTQTPQVGNLKDQHPSLLWHVELAHFARDCTAYVYEYACRCAKLRSIQSQKHFCLGVSSRYARELGNGAGQKYVSIHGSRSHVAGSRGSGYSKRNNMSGVLSFIDQLNPGGIMTAVKISKAIVQGARSPPRPHFHFRGPPPHSRPLPFTLQNRERQTRRFSSLCCPLGTSKIISP